MTKPNQELGKNAASFEQHFLAGLRIAGLNVTDYFPSRTYQQKNKSKIGFGFIQDPNDLDSVCICEEDGLHFNHTFNGVMIPINKKQPASLIATMVLASILTNKVLAPPKYSHCEEEDD